MSHRYLNGPAVDQVLADEQLTPVTGGGYDLTSPGNAVWTLSDNEGTIRDLAVYNAGTGSTTVGNHRMYDPFGKLVSQTNPATGNAAAVDCLFGYAGCATDSNTDIEFHERRVKISGSPDWLSPDPINLTSGVTNLDDYCGNNPINATDPSGLEPKVTAYLLRLAGPATAAIEKARAALQRLADATTQLASAMQNPRNVNAINQARANFNTVAQECSDLTNAAQGEVRQFVQAAGEMQGQGGEGAAEFMAKTQEGLAAAQSQLSQMQKFVDGVTQAQQLYPNLAGQIQQHHITPQFLGGAANGPTVALDRAYHQLITNAFQAEWHYGTGLLPSAAELQAMMQRVYAQYPLPPH